MDRDDSDQVRVIVTGDRNLRPTVVAVEVVGRLQWRYGDKVVIVHGDASGVDATFRDVARGVGVRDEPHPADWDYWETRGNRNRAGPERNSEMVRLGATFAVAVHRSISFSRGTADCCRKCLNAGIPVWLIDKVELPVDLIRLTFNHLKT
jgi:hypothetical protein